tara:strand:- start:98 stop:502 length:405 start_codon:yes stop_codon:yes gene_type:complete
MKLLILHGPNMNLFGLRSAQKGDNLTLDKINRHIRQYIRKKNIDIKIIQTHNEAKAVSYLQNNRTKFNGLILTPCAWNQSAYILNDLLRLLKLKYVVINLNKTDDNQLFSSAKMIFNDDILVSFEQCLDYFNEK